MKITFPTYITLECKNEKEGRQAIDGNMRYASLFRRDLSWNIGRGIPEGSKPPWEQESHAQKMLREQMEGNEKT